MLHLLASDGRLFRCDVTSTLSNGAVAATDDAASDEDWEEKEASRTHSVKFSDPQDQDNKEVKYLLHSKPNANAAQNTLNRVGISLNGLATRGQLIPFLTRLTFDSLIITIVAYTCSFFVFRVFGRRRSCDRTLRTRRSSRPKHTSCSARGRIRSRPAICSRSRWWRR